MTRKDYILIANVFAQHKKRYGGRTDSVVDHVIEEMGEALQEENTRFDPVRFKEACNGREL
jgi:hypothetical protein